MTCCGPLKDISTMDDFIPVYLCTECGKQGPPSAFPDEREPSPEPMTPFARMRETVAGGLDRLANWIAPRY